MQIYGGINNNIDHQPLLFEEKQITFDDKKLFKNDVNEWPSDLKLKYELEVIGFYFSNHPLLNYPKCFFNEIGVIDYEDLILNQDIRNAKLVGSILDIKERSNKDGKKYAFITISNINSQFEMSIFSDTLRLYNNLIKEGNILLFHVDISRDNENIRIVIRKIESIETVYNSHKYKFNLFLNNSYDIELLNELVSPSKNNDELFIFFEKNGKLISFDFSKIFKITNFSKLDKYNQSQRINYSLEIQ